MRTGLIVLGIAVLLVACAAPPKAPEGPKLTAEQTDPGPFPEDYELRIISWLRMNSPDPDAVRVVSVQPPQPVALDDSRARPRPREGRDGLGVDRLHAVDGVRRTARAAPLSLQGRGDPGRYHEVIGLPPLPSPPPRCRTFRAAAPRAPSGS